MNNKETRQCAICGDKKKGTVVYTKKSVRALQPGEFRVSTHSIKKTCSSICSAKYNKIQNALRGKIRYHDAEHVAIRNKPEVIARKAKYLADRYARIKSLQIQESQK